MFVVWVGVNGPIVWRVCQDGGFGVHFHELWVDNCYCFAVSYRFGVEIKYGHERRYLIFVYAASGCGWHDSGPAACMRARCRLAVGRVGQIERDSFGTTGNDGILLLSGGNAYVNVPQ